MQTVIVIPSRLGATRLPNKPLALIGGIPMVVCVARQAQKCKQAESVVVATDSTLIAEVVEQHGFKAMMTSEKHATGTDRVAEVAAKLNAEYIVNLQGDEPFADPQDLAIVIEGLKNSSADIVTLRAPITAEEFNNPNVCKVVVKDDNYAMYFSRAGIPFDRFASGSFENVHKHIGVYGYKAKALKTMSQTPMHFLEQREGLEQLRALAKGMTILVQESKNVSPARGIDTSDDLIWAQTRVNTLSEAAFP